MWDAPIVLVRCVCVVGKLYSSAQSSSQLSKLRPRAGPEPPPPYWMSPLPVTVFTVVLLQMIAWLSISSTFIEGFIYTLFILLYYYFLTIINIQALIRRLLAELATVKGVPLNYLTIYYLTIVAGIVKL